MTMQSLCILLPVTSKGHATPQACLTCLQRLGDTLQPPQAHSKACLCSVPASQATSKRGTAQTLASMSSSSGQQPLVTVCVGLDADDKLTTCIPQLKNTCFPAEVAVEVHVFEGEQLARERRRCDDTAPLCWIWTKLAQQAQQAFQPDWLLLLGDDTEVQPPGWPAVLAGHIQQHPHLRCVALLDASDPGFPSFPAVASSHLDLFGRMLPEELLNQGGDPLLYELYRSIGAASICSDITVHNAVGGPQGSIFPAPGAHPTSQPRYTRCPLLVPDWRELLDHWRQELLLKLPNAKRRMQVAVAVPTYRVNIPALSAILASSTCRDDDVDIRVLVQVDNPHAPAQVIRWLQQEQRARLDGMRVRINSVNQGAAASRNGLLNEAAPCDYIIMFDDDVEPGGSVQAYVSAFKQHPEEAGYAGPTYLPHQPDTLLPTAIHMSDVSFFWEAPAALAPHVPWAVTANMAVRNTNTRFRPGFPKTGGGEDVDFCVLLGHRLLAVPGAAAVHPWWPERRPKVYLRFWGWAEGDGRLVDLWPMSYRRAPNPPELCLHLILLGTVLLPARLLSLASLAGSLLAVLLADLAFTLLRNCCLEERRRKHPCAHCWMRPVAAAEAFVIATLFSEGGRLAGHLKRRQWGNLCRSFDWFCGSLPGVVREEQVRVALRAACCLAAVAAWLLLWGSDAPAQL